MPAFGAIRLLDANVWLALAFSDHVHHGKALAWVSGKEANFAFCRVTQMALLRHLTNVKIMGRFVQTQQAEWTTYDACVRDPRTMYIDEPSNLELAFRGFTSAAVSANSLWTDSYLAAFALTADLTLASFDKGLRRFSSVRLEILE